jgi:segregation and condensation protein B
VTSDVQTTVQSDLARAVEALLFVTDEPVASSALAQALEADRRDVDAACEELAQSYERRGSGLAVRNVAGGWRLFTHPDVAPMVERYVLSARQARLTKAALETLAVVAYKQPVTAPEVNEIRGVDSSGVFGSLLARKLITTAGRKQVIGRPILYKTTKEFLMRFGLKDVNELPSMDEFEKMASELEEIEPSSITDAEAADAEYESEGDAGPALDENALEDIDDDSPPSAGTSTPTPEPPSESNSQTEPAE